MFLEFPEIEKVEIDKTKISSFHSESEFMGLTVKLLVEVGSYLIMAGNFYLEENREWTRNDAIVVGHAVRLYKIISAMLDQTCQLRREISFMMARLAFECNVNLRYFLKNHSNSEVFNSYVQYSLQHERKLFKLIKQNISDRGGEPLPIEKRMMESIEKSFKASNLDSNAEYPKIKNWGGESLFDKARSLGLDELYLVAFGGGSHTIHGNWQDLLEYHLITEENTFRPNFEWHLPRPQVLNVTAYISVDTIIDYLNWLFESRPPDYLVEKLVDLKSRINLIEELHENFLRKINQ